MSLQSPPDPRCSRAVLVAVGASTAAVHGLRSVLTSPDGLGLAGCVLLADPGSAADVVRALDRAAEEAEDLFLVHCSGRVLLGDDGAPHIRMVGTDERYPATTALPLAEVGRVVRRSRAARRVVLLDCAPGHLVDDFPDVDGVFVLSAPGRTPRLVSALRDGIAGEGPFLTLDALATACGGRVHDGGLGAAVIARNGVERVRVLQDRLADTEHLLVLLEGEYAKTAEVVDAVRVKISSAAGLTVADVLGGPKAALAELAVAAAAGHWSRVADGIDAVEARINTGSGELSALHAQADELLGQREELRGRLTVYLAMAVRLGLAEDGEIAALHRAAYQMLWTAPCDLDRATVAVGAYQNAVIGRRG
ncbi:hypothetical protein [Actinokineospora inagensis]|uniref:hypothetical protein n=1 Tax=Actinokineospora inagensis TaxID=103730 RepID=UPI00041162CF|nr:hypothetical protein [Actinokineospora inagensis]